ncbi:alpha/beta hydrolase [Streptomyces sp. NPDC049555]|uniref:alpha/beta hydrolase family protein n=1 Tax=Streptomyces sp. NPDC049555 TaxID=3154930 RepID=UPI003434E6D6
MAGSVLDSLPYDGGWCAMGRDVLTRPAPPPPCTERYGRHGEHVVEVWPAPRARAPLVLVVHGGFWRAAYDRRHLRPMAHALAARGYMVVVPEYRRTGAGGGWPGTFDDIAAATDAVGPLALRYDADPARQVWAGHSAGGHLVLWAAARHRLPARSRWHRPPAGAGVLCLAGCTSLGLAALWDLDGGAVRALLGGAPARVPQRYALADPGWLLPAGVRARLLHGTADAQVPLAMSRAYAARARRLGDAVTLEELPGADHFAPIDPRSPVWPRVLAAVADLADTGAAAGPGVRSAHD